MLYCRSFFNLDCLCMFWKECTFHHVLQCSMERIACYPTKSKQSRGANLSPGSAKANGRKSKICFGRVFNFKLGVSKTLPRFSPESLSLSMLFLLKHWKLLITGDFLEYSTKVAKFWEVLYLLVDNIFADRHLINVCTNKEIKSVGKMIFDQTALEGLKNIAILNYAPTLQFGASITL
jgi:hypothetical protein